jgi:hypothetical protein
MAIKLYANSIALPAPMKAATCDPSDSRIIVTAKADLTNAANTWGLISGVYCPIYLGMPVFVEETKEIYSYVGPSDTNGILAKEVNKIANWRKLSDGNTSSDEIIKRFEALEKELADRIKIDAVGSTSTVILTVDETVADTPTLKADVKNSADAANIIQIKDDGIFASVTLAYNAATNALTFNNGKTTTPITLNAGSLLKSITYDSTTEKLVITYESTSDPGKDIVTKVPVKDLIEEYSYPNTTTTMENDGNVLFKVDRNVNGKTEIRADVQVFDCGTY